MDISEHNKRVYRATIKYDYLIGRSLHDIKREYGLIFTEEEINKIIKEE